MHELGTATARVDWAERLAIGASVACLLHCVGLPIFLASLPALSSVLSFPESVHIWVLALAAPTAFAALLVGLARHGRTLPLIAGLTGLALLAAGALLFDDRGEVPATVIGSLLLVGAHVTNRRLRHADPAWPIGSLRRRAAPWQRSYPVREVTADGAPGQHEMRRCPGASTGSM